MHTPLQEILAVRASATLARYDIYASIHKGMRLLLCDALTRAGRVAHQDPVELADFVARVEAAISLCEAHLAHENEFIHPALERVQTGTSARIAAEHLEHLQDLQTLRQHTDALMRCEPDLRGAACHALYLALGLFTAHNLAHMHLEETEHNAVLWAHYSDEEIAALEGLLVSQLSPHDLMSSMRWMIPGLSAAERLGLLSEMQRHAPPAAFGAVLALAREVLDAADWAALAQGLGVPAAAQA